MSAILKDQVIDAAFGDFEPQFKRVFADQNKATDALADATQPRLYRFSDDEYREPVKDERYWITWAATGDTHSVPYMYLGNGMFEVLDSDDYDLRGANFEPFKVEPSEVECLEKMK